MCGMKFSLVEITPHVSSIDLGNIVSSDSLMKTVDTIFYSLVSSLRRLNWAPYMNDLNHFVEPYVVP
jgi:hypothetical protein